MVSTPLVLVNNMSHVLSLLEDHKTDVAISESTQNNPMFIRGLNYILDSGHILWWSTPLVLVINMSDVLSLLDYHKTDVAM